ncbi:hypothetical protein VM1G_01184 [Cytospora mali]|uniref:Uncharacterized protein n=1 Tax=Cytospora mali TaxID=578113 RepID=A0A194VMW1_CYTMA|nr:hypothetical protein VM1G_01184 [Valsa mali]
MAHGRTTVAVWFASQRSNRLNQNAGANKEIPFPTPRDDLEKVACHAMTAQGKEDWQLMGTGRILVLLLRLPRSSPMQKRHKEGFYHPTTTYHSITHVMRTTHESITVTDGTSQVCSARLGTALRAMTNQISRPI